MLNLCSEDLVKKLKCEREEIAHKEGERDDLLERV